MPDVLEKIDLVENNSTRGQRAKIGVYDDAAEIDKEEIKKHLIDYTSAYEQQRRARERLMKKLIERDPNYLNRRIEMKEKMEKLHSEFKRQQRDLDTGSWGLESNDNKFFNFIEFLFSFYNSFCELNEENLTLKEISNDEIFAKKNEEIEKLKEERNNLVRENQEKLSLEETEKVMEWYAEHVTENEGEHKIACYMFNDGLGACRIIECSCGASYDLRDWEDQ